jgi:para-nitrobenzyl esterase
LTAVITDSHFACPILTFHRLIGSRAPFYAYEFSDPHAPRAFVQAPGGPDPRAYHGAELAYVFQTSWAGTDASTLTPVQRKLAVDMQDRWGAFARTGKPTAASQASWPIFDGRQPLSFAPGEGDKFVADFAKAHRCDFWNAHGY